MVSGSRLNEQNSRNSERRAAQTYIQLPAVEYFDLESLEPNCLQVSEPHSQTLNAFIVERVTDFNADVYQRGSLSIPRVISIVFTSAVCLDRNADSAAVAVANPIDTQTFLKMVTRLTQLQRI